MTHDQLKEMRKRNGLSVTEAARLVHVADRTWQRYESGKQDIPGAIVELFRIKLGTPYAGPEDD